MSVDNKVSSLLPFLSSPRLLAGESEAEFQSGLQSLLSELDNPSPLAIALITQLNECLWWIKRHTVDKELLLHESMAKILARAGTYSEVYDNHLVSTALESFLTGNSSKEEKAWIEGMLVQSKLTVSDLRALGFKTASKYIKMADELIHRQYQTIRHLQRSIDAVDFKSRIIKRMDLELADLEKKTLAIDVKSS
jgi:hypothetical protein